MIAALLSLLFSLPYLEEYGGYYQFAPPAPTDRSFVTLQVRDVWRDGCVPRNERVTRSGSAIHVRYEVPRNTGCTLALREWNDDAPLGVLPAGVYTVTVDVNDYDGVVPLETLTLVVTEAEPALHIVPRIASTAGGTEITFPLTCGPATLLVDGAAVPVSGCPLRATLPPHAAGAVNVRLTTATSSLEVVNGVQYVDPAALPDPALYERVLIPVLFEGPGAFGSRWETEATLTNTSATPLESLPAVSRPLPASIAPREQISLSTVFGSRPEGLLLFLPRGSDVRFTNHIRDVSRDAAQWGTEIPVVRESDTSTDVDLVLRNVPFDPRYRLQLRVYGIDGGSTSVAVTSPPFEKQVVVPLRGSCAERFCNSNAPAYGSLDLRQAFPAQSGKRDVVIAQSFYYQPRRLWAFITVTNNETQHVTVISPQ